MADQLPLEDNYLKTHVKVLINFNAQSTCTNKKAPEAAAILASYFCKEKNPAKAVEYRALLKETAGKLENCPISSSYQAISAIESKLPLFRLNTQFLLAIPNTYTKRTGYIKQIFEKALFSKNHPDDLKPVIKKSLLKNWKPV